MIRFAIYGKRKKSREFFNQWTTLVDFYSEDKDHTRVYPTIVGPLVFFLPYLNSDRDKNFIFYTEITNTNKHARQKNIRIVCNNVD